MSELIKKLYSLRHLRSPEYQTTESIIEKGIAELEAFLADAHHWRLHWKEESTQTKAENEALREAAFRVLLRHRTRIAGPSLVYYEYPSKEMEALVALLKEGNVENDLSYGRGGGPG